MDRLGLIAGSSRFPIIFAEAAKRQGLKLVAVAHTGETPEQISALVPDVTWVRVGELGKLIAAFKRAGVTRAVMAGGIDKARALADFCPDERGAAFIARLPNLKDDVLLRGIAAELEGEGIRIVESTLFLGHLIAPDGVLTARQPDAQQWKDVRLGVQVAKAIGRWDIGQSVVVKRGTVLAVEGIEGTSAAIRRGGALGGRGIVVVKVSKPQQDLRFDVPAVGPETIGVLDEVGGQVLALEAGKTLMIDKEKLLEGAEGRGIAVVGVRGDQSVFVG